MGRNALRLGLFQAARILAPASKAIGDDYEAQLEVMLENGASAEQHKAKLTALLGSIAWLAYQSGMERGGITDPAKQMTAADNAYIAAWITGQAVFVPALADAIAEYQAMPPGDEKTAERERMENRIALWVATLAVLIARGYASAQADKMGVWRYGDTDHCDTCLGLNGKRARLSWFVENGYIPREPGSETLSCHGYRCKCTIFDDSGKQLMP